MCGRYTLSATEAAIIEAFAVEDVFMETALTPRFNLAPTQQAPIVFAKDGSRVLTTYQWGLVPFFAKEAGSKRPFINGYVYYEHSSSPIEGAVISFTYKGVTYFGTSGSNGYYEVYADVLTGFLRWYEIKCKYNGVEKEWTESTLFWITHDFYYYPRDFK